MPRSFPTMESLTSNAKMRNFRQPNEGESEEEYREAFADFMRGVDLVESAEIRSGKGWNAQSPEEMLRNMGLNPRG